MKTALYYVSTKEDNWMDIVIEDFRWIATSGLFNTCDKFIIFISNNKTNTELSGEEWVKFVWGRVDNTDKVEIHIVNEPPDIKKWITPDIIYANTNLNR